jgi:hypothetical protein
VIKVTTRRVGRDIARIGVVLSAGMLVAGLGSGVRVSAAGINAGALQVLTGPSFPSVGQPLTGGDTDDRFSLQPPAAAACSGDSATGGYRIQSFMVPASVDLSALTFDSNGPLPFATGASLRLPLFAQGTSFVEGNTAIGTGAITGVPAFDFGVFGGADGSQLAPPGSYRIGLACTLGPASATQLDKFWSVQLTLAATASGSITWTVVAPTTPTSTTTTTTTTTTTVPGSTTTTTTPGSTTTTTSSTTSSSTTTTIRAGSSAVQSAAGASTGSGTGSGSGGLAATGSSPLPIVVWAVLLLVFGRTAILLGRRHRVIPPERR